MTKQQVRELHKSCQNCGLARTRWQRLNRHERCSGCGLLYRQSENRLFVGSQAVHNLLLKALGVDTDDHVWKIDIEIQVDKVVTATIHRFVGESEFKQVIDVMKNADKMASDETETAHSEVA